MDSALLKSVLIVAVVLVMPLGLLAFGGESFMPTLERWKRSPPRPTAIALGVAAMLACDVVLPVPSGPVTTLAGSHLGWLAGAGSAFVGMSLGAAVAFALARRWGRPMAERLSGRERFAAAEAACARHGTWLLLAARPVPILAEASALVVGAWQLSWSRFWPPILFGNALIAVGYAALGEWAADRGWLPAALCASAAAPVAIGVWLTRRRAEAAKKQPRR